MDQEMQEKSQSERIIESAKVSEESSGAAFMNPQVKKPSKPRGRPKKDASAPSSEAKQSGPQDAPKGPSIETKLLAMPLVKVMSSAGVAYTKDPRAAMNPDEAEAIASGMGMVLDKYLPDIASKYGPELVLGVSMGQWGLRLYAIKQLQIINERQKQAQSQPKAQENARPQEGHVTFAVEETDKSDLPF